LLCIFLQRAIRAIHPHARDVVKAKQLKRML